MTPEERHLLERTAKLAEDNNTILRSIRRSNRVSMIMRIVYWVVIIGVSYGAYVIVQPYIDQALSLYTEAQQNLEAVKGATTKFGSFFK
ncbi:MAG: hypothetical protein RIT04_511 [Candidatus Parcubacteria bacterium]|jgi:hypothetical protein